MFVTPTCTSSGISPGRRYPDGLLHYGVNDRRGHNTRCGKEGGRPVNLFAYGTLMDHRTMARVTGRRFPTPTPAILHGYVKYDTRFGYPVIFPEPNQSVEGVVYTSLSPDDWKKLDQYEEADAFPPHYVRRLIVARGQYGTIRAYAYIGNHLHFSSRTLRLE